MIDIETLRRYVATDAVYITQHTAKRFRERGIRIKDIKTAIADGCIIEQYENDTPFPSCLLCGPSTSGKILHKFFMLLSAMKDPLLVLLPAIFQIQLFRIIHLLLVKRKDDTYEMFQLQV